LGGKVEDAALLGFDELFNGLLGQVGVGAEFVQFVDIATMVFLIVEPVRWR